MLEILDNLDTGIFLAINGLHNSFFDVVMVYISARFFWIPFYLLLLYLIFQEKKWKTLLVILFVSLLITISDQVSVHAFKNVFQRPRPCHTVDLQLVVHTVEKCGGKFGFISSHASNSFALAIFVSGILRSRFIWMPWLMFSWAVLTIYSRVYLGVHFPGDVFVGAIVGFIIGWIVLLAYQYTEPKFFKKAA